MQKCLKQEIIDKEKVRLGSGVSRKVAVHGQPVYIHGPNGNQSLNILPADLTTSEQKTAYIAPIQCKNNALGTININNVPESLQSDSEREGLIKKIIESCTQFVKHRDFLAWKTKSPSELFVANIFREHDALRQFRILFDYLFHTITDLFNLPKKGLFLVKNLDSDLFDLVLGYGFSVSGYNDLSQLVNNHLKTDQLFSAQEATIFNRQEIFCLPKELIQESYCLCIPMTSDKQTSSYLLLFTEEYLNMIDFVDNYVLKTLCRQAAISIENTNIALKFRELTFTDSLTGTYNYGLWCKRFSEEINRSQRHKIQELSLVVFDIDHFELLNKDLGQFIGDNLLYLIAERIKENVRIEDIVGRIGGDEFGVILPQTSKNHALLLTEKILGSIRTILEDMHIAPGKELSLSGGISFYPLDAESPQDLLEKAKTALISAKIQGGNRVQSYEYPEE